MLMNVTRVPDDGQPLVDVVIVAYNSGRHLRQCVEQLAGCSWLDVVVVDNASTDDSTSTIADLPARVLAQSENLGFARACNIGWQSTDGPYVLFINPDAEMNREAVAHLTSALDREDDLGIVGPRLMEAGGSIAYSQRRFPTLRSTFSQALFLHRVFPTSAWADEVVRDERRYLEASDVEWLSGACLLIRREALERIGGWDESFLLYSEDTEICRAAWSHGYRVRYEPEAVARHEGGGSAPRWRLRALLASSRIAYARKNYSPPVALGHRVGIGLEALTHMVVCRGGVAPRRGHAAALLATLQPARASRLLGA
jgi:GT2 family glycosyltransferase